MSTGKDLNPFNGNEKMSEVSVMANSDAERSVQEVQAAMVIAKKFPRDSREASERILNACTRESLAATAIYSYPRGGTQITGPSIRLAEAIAQEWQNIQFGVRELSSDNGVSTVESFAWDMQTNTRSTKVFQVKHERKARGQIRKLDDPRDIYELVANQGARRLRSCILAVIPGDVVEAAVTQCNLTQQTNVDVSIEAIKAMVGFFDSEFNVKLEHIEKKIGRRIDAINTHQMLNLKQIAQSLKDGMAKPWDFFEMDVPELRATTQSNIGADISQQANNKKPEPEPAGASQENLEDMV